MIPIQIQELLTKERIPFAIVADVPTGKTCRMGAPSTIPWSDLDLVRALFGDSDSIHATDRSLEGQLMPRLWTQGTISCTLIKPDPNHILGVFSITKPDAAEQYLWAETINARILAVWNGPHGPGKS